MDPSDDKLNDAEHLLGELESIESNLRRLQQGLTRSHRLATLGTMASIVAHEFNNILTPVISYCQLAQQAPDDLVLQQKAVAKALAGAERAAQISGSMLGFSSDANQPGEEGCEVESVVQEVFNCLARPPQKDGIELKLGIEPGCRVAMTPVSLQQVLLNLVLNARQVLRDRGGKLWLSAWSEGRWSMIEVADTGPGIPPDLLPTVFEPFVTRRGGGSAASSEGTGLGLAVCRDLVERAGGNIGVVRSDATGTTFRIELKRAEETAADTGSASVPEPEAEGESESGSNRRSSSAQADTPGDAPAGEPGS
jgi:signal transduction histidine kinase